MATTIKTVSELSLSYKSVDTDPLTGNTTLVFNLANPYRSLASLVSAEWSVDDGATWEIANTAQAPQEVDFNIIQMQGPRTEVPILWASAIDLFITPARTGVLFRVRFNDRPYQAGVTSLYIISVPFDINFLPPVLENFTFPKSNDPYFKYVVYQFPAIRYTRLHWTLEISENADFSDPVVTKDSSTSQLYWTVDGQALPATGWPIDTDGEKIEVIFDDPATAGVLDNGTVYYSRMTPEVVWTPILLVPTDNDSLITTEGLLLYAGKE